MLHGGDGVTSSEALAAGDESKQDMNDRLENLLTKEAIDANDVAFAGTVEDFSITGKKCRFHSPSGFSEDANHSLHADEDWALLLIEDDDQEKLYTAAILMSEYGTFDSSDMDLMNDAIHKI